MMSEAAQLELGFMENAELATTHKNRLHMKITARKNTVCVY